MQTLSIQVIRADVEHLDAFSALLDQYRLSLGETSDLPEAEHYLFSRMTKDDALLFLALRQPQESQGKETPIGFIQLTPSFSVSTLKTILMVNALYVVPGLPWEAVAAPMLEEAKAFAALRDDYRLVLDLLPIPYADAGFFQTLGFAKEPSLDRYLYNLQ